MRKILLILMLGLFFSCGQNSQSKKETPTKAKQAQNFLHLIGYSDKNASYQLLDKAVNFYFVDNLKFLTADDLKDTDAIFAFSFGQGDGTPPTPGGSNEGLAEICEQLFQLSDKKLHIYAQWEIADVLLKNYQTPSTYKADVKGEYLSTEGVLNQFMNFNNKKGINIKKVVVVAQRDHAFRVIKLVEKQNIKVIFGANSCTPNNGWDNYNCDKWGYFKNSSQPWTTNRGNFITHELYWVNVAFLDGKINN